MLPLPDDADETYHYLNQGLALYASGARFEAHEAWEYAWGGEVGRRKLTLQALVQIAAALHKHETGNPRGTCKLLAKAHAKIQEIREGASAVLSLDLVALEEEVARALAQADAIARGEAVTLVPPALPEVVAESGILYLHGFASGPSSAKAQVFAPALRGEGYAVTVPDLNEDDFEHLTVSRALARAKRLLFDRTLIVGSSLGGYIAALLAAKDDRVKGLVLMAPAFDFAARLEARHDAAALSRWKTEGAVMVEHYAYGGEHRIGYGLLEDARHHPGRPPLRVPTYILQGKHDDVVPAELVEKVARAAGPKVELELVEDEHGLSASAHRALERTLRMARDLGLRPAPEPFDGAEVLAAMEAESDAS